MPTSARRLETEETVSVTTVSWRQAIAAIVAVVVALFAVTVVLNSDGLPAVDASSSRALHWFVHRPSGSVVLVDGYGGRAIASIEAEVQGQDVSVAEAAAGAYLLNDSTAEVRPIETAELRVGPAVGLSALGGGRALSAVGPGGLTVVDPVSGQATLLPLDGEPIPFDVTLGDGADASNTAVAPDGSVWNLDGSTLRRQTSTSTTEDDLDLGDGAQLTLVGSQPFVVDPSNRRAKLGDGSWQTIDSQIDPSEFVAQQAGPSAGCGWVGANDDLWCVAADGIAERATVPGLDIDGIDLLAIAGDAAALVRRGPAAIVRFDWRTAAVLEDRPLSVDPDEVLEVSTGVDLVWVDEVDRDQVWAVNPWGVNVVDKDDADIFTVGDDGTIIDQGDVDESTTPATDDGQSDDVVEREPDDNGVDDPPIAVDDAVTARSGSSVTVQVTANDYDPDGEAIAVADVGVPGHGVVEIGTASTVVYTPDPGYVGVDTFEYTITDGNGTEDSASVVIELLTVDATNNPPIGGEDDAETGPGTPVVIDVLLNDVDPERDALRIGSFTPPNVPGGAIIGEVTETRGPSGLPALRYVPAPGFEGTALFSYRPVDALGGQGDDVEVRVEVATDTDANRPPFAQPDAVRARRDVVTPVPVLVNDVDPDGDDLTLTIVEPLPAGLEVEVRGVEVAVTVRAGAAELIPFMYELSDGRGGTARGAVLVDVIDEIEPNLPPVLTADTGTVVDGASVSIDVLANDSDPDRDALVIVGVTQPANALGRAEVLGGRVRFTPAPIGDRDETNARFTYTVTDGHDHAVTGDVSISILRESVAQPPYARDDSTFTTVGSPVTVDVLRNDGDPSGERPYLVGEPGCAGGGRATVTTDNQVRYDPPAGTAGAFRCTYEVSNAQGLRAGASIIISVREPSLTNQAPVTANDPITVEVGSVTSVDVTANDTDPDGDNAKLTVLSSTAPTLGTATRRGNTITFTAGQTLGNTAINYQVADEGGAVSVGRMVVTISEKSNRPPVAQSDAREIFGPGAPASFDVLSKAVDEDNTPGGMKVVSATRVSGDGTVSFAGPLVTITPNPNYLGSIVASFTIADGQGLTSSALLTLNVVEQPNRPPAARDDNADVANGGSVTVPVLFNDSDPDGDPLSVAVTAGPDPSLGTARLAGDRSIVFTAAPGASGLATIDYEISDGELTSSARARITVRACTESQPVASNGSILTGYQQPVAVNLAAYGSNGSFVDVTGPAGYDATSGVYTPPAGENGNVTVTYAVVNGCRQRSSGTITIDVNQEPAAQAQSFAVGRGELREVPVSAIASDAEALVIDSSAGAPAWVSTESGRLVIQPPAGTPVGEVRWTTIVRDPGGLTAAVPMSVTVTNLAPSASADSIDVSGGSPVVASVLDNDVDPDGPNSALTFQHVPATILFANGQSGTISIVGSRQLSIDPLGGRGAASFTYTVQDGDGAISAPATVTVSGPALNNPPIAVNQVVNVTVGSVVNLVLDVSDPDGDPLTLIDVLDVNGVLGAQVGLTLVVIPLVEGTFQVTYRVSDGTAQSSTATVTINATAGVAPTTTEPPSGGDG
jgi:hypothetical protein